MSISSYRRQRSRTIPQPGSLGAPLRGVYTWGNTSADGVNGEFIASIIEENEVGGSQGVSLLIPNKPLPSDCVAIFYNGAPVTPSSVTAKPDGKGIDVVFPSQAGAVDFWVKAAHTGLVAINGMANSGAYANG